MRPAVVLLVFAGLLGLEVSNFVVPRRACLVVVSCAAILVAA